MLDDAELEYFLNLWGVWARVGGGTHLGYPSMTVEQAAKLGSKSTIPAHLAENPEAEAVERAVSALQRFDALKAQVIRAHYVGVQEGGRIYRVKAKEVMRVLKMRRSWYYRNLDGARAWVAGRLSAKSVRT